MIGLPEGSTLGNVRGLAVGILFGDGLTIVSAEAATTKQSLLPAHAIRPAFGRHCLTLVRFARARGPRRQAVERRVQLSTVLDLD